MATVFHIGKAEAFPSAGSMGDKLAYLVSRAILAPSIFNTQPWKFEVDENGVDVYADRTRQLVVADPEGRELAISIGAAVYILRLGMKAHGMRPLVDYKPDHSKPDLLARVTCQGVTDIDGESQSLFDEVGLRQTATGQMDSAPIDLEELKSLRNATQDEHVRFEWIKDVSLRGMVVEMVREGDRLLFHDQKYREEFAAWMRPNGATQFDGVPGEAMGYGDIAAGAAPWIVKHFDVGAFMASQDSEYAENAPSLGVFCTKHDDLANWLDTGQALCHFELLASHYGLVCSVFNQPMQVVGLRARFAREHGFCAFPQAFIRVGFGSGSNTRRPIAQVLEVKTPCDCGCEGCEDKA